MYIYIYIIGLIQFIICLHVLTIILKIAAQVVCNDLSLLLGGTAFLTLLV